MIAEVHRLIDTVTTPSQGVWARSAALLARQALEAAVRVKLDAYSTGLDSAPFRAQLLCLQGVIGDNDVAREANDLWSALSRATHHSGYELAPTTADLREWLAGGGGARTDGVEWADGYMLRVTQPVPFLASATGAGVTCARGRLANEKRKRL